jgi:hypothetical protein
MGLGTWPVIPILAGFGWDMNARARVDFPMEQEWETTLHEAAGSVRSTPHAERANVFCYGTYIWP